MAPVDRLLNRLGLDFGGISLRSEARSPITPHVVVGARPPPNEEEALAAEGITHVCSCLDAHVFPKVGFLATRFARKQLPLRDAMDEDAPRFFPSFAGALPPRVLRRPRQGRGSGRGARPSPRRPGRAPRHLRRRDPPCGAGGAALSGGSDDESGVLASTAE